METTSSTPSDPLRNDASSDSATAEAGAGDKSSAMTWLQAAEHILREEGPEMHIRDLTRRIMEKGIVNSSCTTSLETLLYRQTSKGNSKFVRVMGKMGWFGLKGEGTDGREEKPTIVLPSERPLVAGVAMHRGSELEMDYEPQVFYKRKRRLSYGSDSSSAFSSSEEDDEEDSRSSDEEDEELEILYHKKYNFVKKIAKNIIYVRECQVKTNLFQLMPSFDPSYFIVCNSGERSILSINPVMRVCRVGLGIG